VLEYHPTSLSKKKKNQSDSNGFSQMPRSRTLANQLVDNRPKAIAQRKLQTMVNNPNPLSFSHLKSNTTKPIQKRAFIGKNEIKPNAPNKKLTSDPIIRRFKSKSEFKTFREDENALDHIGLDQDNEWMRVDKFTVLGETHGTEDAKNIINAIGTKRWRYEGGTDFGKEKFKSVDFKKAQSEKLNEGYRKKGFKDNTLGNRSHNLEMAWPKYARALPDAIPLIDYFKSQENMDYNERIGVFAGKKYNLTGAILSVSAQTLVFIKEVLPEYKEFNNIEGNQLDLQISLLQSVYKSYISIMKSSDSIEISIEETKLELKSFDESIAKLDLSLLSHLSDIMASIAKSKETSLFKKRNLKTLEASKMTHAAKSKLSNEMDLYRDLSMLKELKKSSRKDLLFIVGEEHMEKLKLIKGISNADFFTTTDFIELNKSANDKLK